MDVSKKWTPQMAQKVFYEFTMFRWLGEKVYHSAFESGAFLPGEVTFAGTGYPRGDEVKQIYCELESFLLHVRVVRDFFFDPKIGYKPDDVAAIHFLPDWNSYCPPVPTYLGGCYERLNKALAHLSLKRLDYDEREKRWEVSTLRSDLTPIIDLFLSKLSPDQREWFKETPDEDLFRTP